MAVPYDLDTVMASDPHRHRDPPSLSGAGMLAVSIAAAAIVGLLTLIQSAPSDVPPPPPAGPNGTAPRDAGALRQHIESAPETDGDSRGAHEQ
jgi:hypothetical protein